MRGAGVWWRGLLLLLLVQGRGGCPTATTTHTPAHPHTHLPARPPTHPLKGERLAAGVRLEGVAARMEGYSGDDVRAVCREAAMAVVRAQIGNR